MADRPDVIQMGGIREVLSQEYLDAAQVLRPLSDRAVVQMDPERESVGLIELPEDVQGRLRPDRGTILAAHEDTGLSPGDVVYVLPYDGLWMKGEKFGSFEPTGLVRFYGCITELSRSILMVEAETVEDIVEGRVRVTGDNVVLQRDPKVTHQGVFELPDSEKYRNCQGVVLAIGPEAEEISPGARVLYSPQEIRTFQYGDDDDVGIISQEYIYCVIEEDDGGRT